MSRKMRKLVASLEEAARLFNTMPTYTVTEGEMVSIGNERVIHTAHYSGITFNCTKSKIIYKLHEKEDYEAIEVIEFAEIGTVIRLVGDGKTKEKFRVKYQGEASYCLKLDHVVIDLRGEEAKMGAPITIGEGNTGAVVTIQLVGKNKLYASDENAGIELHGYQRGGVIIESAPNVISMGCLEVSGGANAAAIGQAKNVYRNTGSVTINSGKIIAKGGAYAAAIGGYNACLEKITIAGGDVTAIAHEEGGIPIGSMGPYNWCTKEILFTGGNFVGVGGGSYKSDVKVAMELTIAAIPNKAEPTIYFTDDNVAFRTLFCSMATIDHQMDQILVSASFEQPLTVGESLILKSIDGITERIIPSKAGMTGFTLLVENDIYELVKRDKNGIEIPFKGYISDCNNEQYFTLETIKQISIA